MKNRLGWSFRFSVLELASAAVVVLVAGTGCTVPMHRSLDSLFGADGSNCFAAPGVCGYPDPASGNVGVPAGTALTPSSGFATSANGQVIDGLDVTGQIVVLHDNVTIRNTRVTLSGGGGATGIYVPAGSTGTRILNSTVRGAGASGSAAIEAAVRTNEGTGVVADRVYFYNCADCWEGPGTISNSYLIANGYFDGAHVEPVYFGCCSMNIQHSVVLNPQPQTAAVFGDTNGGGGGPCGNIFTLRDSLIAGGGFMLYPCGNATSVGTSVMTVENNRFGRCKTTPNVYNNTTGGTACNPTGFGGADSHGYWPNGGYFGVVAHVYCPPTAGQTWSGNVWDDNSKPVGCN